MMKRKRRRKNNRFLFYFAAAAAAAFTYFFVVFFSLELKYIHHTLSNVKKNCNTYAIATRRIQTQNTRAMIWRTHTLIHWYEWSHRLDARVFVIKTNKRRRRQRPVFTLLHIEMRRIFMPHGTYGCSAAMVRQDVVWAASEAETRREFDHPQNHDRNARGMTETRWYFCR